MYMGMPEMKVWNTKQKGTLEFLVYLEATKYVGVCLTLDIVEEGEDPKKLMESIVESAMGHVKLVQLKNLDDALLNRPAPQKYWKIYNKVLEELRENRPAGGYVYTMPINSVEEHA